LDGGADARALARQLVDYLRNLMLIQMGNGEQVEVPNDTRAQMVSHAGALSTAELLRMMRAFNAAAIDTRGGWAPSLGLELAFAEMLEAPAGESGPLPAAKTGGAPSQHGKPALPAHHSSAPARPTTPASARAAPVQSSVAEMNAEARPPAVGSTSLEALSKAWHQISAIVKKKDSNVAALLNSGKLMEIKDGVLMIGFASEILQSKFNRPECLELAQAAIREALDVDLPVQAVLAGGKGALPPNVKPDGMVATAIQNGGEIVDIQ